MVDYYYNKSSNIIEKKEFLIFLKCIYTKKYRQFGS